MIDIKINDFNHEVDCIYKGNKYSVRDNGAVLRHPQEGNPLRPLDNKWTFGKPSIQKGYMYFASKFPIHRIVASAFHGEPPSKDHVVDHRDTNHRNNRPENLRWLTRLENILLNPITVKRIILICGSIENFLEDPSILSNSKLDPNFNWMRTVSPEEAEACRAHMLSWVQSDKRNCGGTLGEWVFSLPRNLPSEAMRKSLSQVIPNKPNINQIEPLLSLDHFVFKTGSVDKMTRRYENNLDDLVLAKTPMAAQHKWRTPSEFPCCPPESESDPINAYAEKLVTGVVFSRNQFSTSLVIETALADTNQSILVMCQKAELGNIKPWTLAKITYEDGLYVHENCGSFFDDEGAKKQFCLAQGLDWNGGDTFDDFC